MQNPELTGNNINVTGEDDFQKLEIYMLSG